MPLKSWKVWQISVLRSVLCQVYSPVVPLFRWKDQQVGSLKRRRDLKSNSKLDLTTTCLNQLICCRRILFYSQPLFVKRKYFIWAACLAELRFPKAPFCPLSLSFDEHPEEEMVWGSKRLEMWKCICQNPASSKVPKGQIINYHNDHVMINTFTLL